MISMRALFGDSAAVGLVAGAVRQSAHTAREQLKD